MQLQNGQTLEEYYSNTEKQAKELLKNNDNRKLVVILTGAGISAESGLGVFRGSGGLWEGYDISKVASIRGWNTDPAQVIEFYNLRRQKLLDAEPNPAHKALVELEKYFRVAIITQNVDNLHERAGSSCIIHLHGELIKVRGIAYPYYVYEIGGEPIAIGDVCEKGSQLRPHIVWFGEEVPLISIASQITCVADIFVVVGTSFNVYPAAGLISVTKDSIPKYVVDKDMPDLPGGYYNLKTIEKPASIGVPEVVADIIANYA
ncbi:MAG: Sir2 family NAD-dependent protein deacetylase [Bacteroidia bacterium]|nr:NAD-dependent deacylase [Bacteroidia bacterium]MDW8159511.1 Sir2 family NAD-dependent protein deacetylase [Bacteroidia bacterium]